MLSSGEVMIVLALNLEITVDMVSPGVKALANPDALEIMVETVSPG